MIQTNFIDMENMFDLLKEETEVSRGRGKIGQGTSSCVWESQASDDSTCWLCSSGEGSSWSRAPSFS